MQLKNHSQPQHPWLQKCLENLKKIPQVETTTAEHYHGFADAILTIHTPQKQILEYIVEIKSNVTLQTLDLVIEYLNYLKQQLSGSQRPLLVTDTLSNAVVNTLIEKDIEFIDTTGNIYINNSFMYILIKNRAVRSRNTLTKITISTLKVSYVILRFPKILEEQSQKLASLAGVDIKTAKYSLKTLYKLNYLQRQSGGSYRIKSYKELLERWEMGYVENLRSELLIDKFSPIQQVKFSEISEKIIEMAKHYKFLVGGELGAAIITKYLKPISTVIHIPEPANYRAITTKLRLKPDARGSISILKQFGTQNSWTDDMPIVDPLLIHAELSLHLDERIKETASRIYDEYIVPREELAYVMQ